MHPNVPGPAVRKTDSDDEWPCPLPETQRPSNSALVRGRGVSWSDRGYRDLIAFAPEPVCQLLDVRPPPAPSSCNGRCHEEEREALNDEKSSGIQQSLWGDAGNDSPRGTGPRAWASNAATAIRQDPVRGKLKVY